MIVIYGIKENLNPIKAELSSVIHSCMQSALGLPEDKRAQRFIPLDSEDFYYPADRSAAYTVIEINMVEGRAIATQKALIKALFQHIVSTHRVGGENRTDRYRNHHKRAASALLGVSRDDG